MVPIVAMLLFHIFLTLLLILLFFFFLFFDDTADLRLLNGILPVSSVF